MSTKFVFISNMAAPYQVKFCYSLQKYFNTEFWFYVRREFDRPKWWEIPLGDKCKVMKLSNKVPVMGYFSLGVFYDLVRFNPNIIMLGGFMKYHLLLLKIAKLLNKKVIIMSEPIRYNLGNENSKSAELMTRKNSPKKVKAARKLFDGADLYLGMGDVAARQFVEEFGFPEEKVDTGIYPLDIEGYFEHPPRNKRKGDPIRILFGNRLIDRYQPLFMLEVFEKLSSKHPNLELVMNSDGPLKEACVSFIKEKQLKNVSFLDQITSWNEMHLIYKDSDILVLPATYSNGNGTIFEAMASGMGVVISNQINHMEKYAVDGENCFIRDLNVDDFVQSLETYIQNPEIIDVHGKLGRELVTSEKNESLARDYYELFKKHGLVK